MARTSSGGGGDYAGSVRHRERHDAVFNGSQEAWVPAGSNKSWNQSMFVTPDALAYRAAGDADLAELPELRGKHWLRFFRGATRFDNFQRQVHEFDRSTIPIETSRTLVEQLRSAPGGGDHQTRLDEIFATAEEFKRKIDDWWPAGPLSRRR